MNQHAIFALAHPVFDPGRQIVGRHYWLEDRTVSACLTVNIGMEWTRYAGGRPLWQLSLAAHTSEGPLPVLRWSPTRRRRMERIRDRTFFGLGTDEPLFEEVLPDDLAFARFGHLPISVNWRRPLSLAEVNQMAPTAEVRQRRGRA